MSSRVAILVGLGILAIAAFVAALAIGAMHIPIGDVVATLIHGAGSSRDAEVILTLRLPRALLAVLVGSALSVSGASLQGLFRNPLADPGLIGISGGAALGAVGAILMGPHLAHLLPWLGPSYLLPVVAFVGGLVAMVISERIAGHGSGGTGSLILAGVAVTTVANAGIGVMIYMSNDTQLRDIVFWNMGSLATGGWSGIIMAAPFIAVGLALLLSAARQFDALLLGEREAGHLGIDVRRLKHRAMIGAALAVGAAVAVSGMIPFVGLVVPHIVRLSLGPGHRTLLPAAALLGATLMLAADGVARTIIVPSELPIGLVTSAVGGPFFIGLLLRQRMGNR